MGNPAVANGKDNFGCLPSLSANFLRYTFKQNASQKLFEGLIESQEI